MTFPAPDQAALDQSDRAPKRRNQAADRGGWHLPQQGRHRPRPPWSRLSSASAGTATDSDAAIDIVDIKETKTLSSYGCPMFTAQSARVWSITGHRLMDLADAHVTLRRHM